MTCLVSMALSNQVSVATNALLSAWYSLSPRRSFYLQVSLKVPSFKRAESPWFRASQAIKCTSTSSRPDLLRRLLRNRRMTGWSDSLWNPFEWDQRNAIRWRAGFRAGNICFSMARRWTSWPSVTALTGIKWYSAGTSRGMESSTMEKCWPMHLIMKCRYGNAG